MKTISKRKLIYGGMATAMAVVLIAGVTVTQFNEGLLSQSNSGASYSPAEKLQEGNLNEIYQGDSASTAAVSTETDKNEAVEEAVAVTDSIAPAQQPMASPVSPSYAPMEAKRQAMGAPAKAMARADMAVTNTGGAVASSEMMVAPGYPGVIYPDPMPVPSYHDEGRDKFKDFTVSPVKIVTEEPVSTFSIDVDTASYSFVRSQINMGALPPADSVRIEELVNYFDYSYPLPETREQPFKPTVTVMDSPWSKGKKLVHIGIKGFDVPKTAQPHSNLVFLLDVSGSMNEPNKLPLVKNSIKMLLDTLQANDTISIVVYAGAAGTVLEPTKVSDKSKILSAIDNLSAGGSTAGAAGINLAYQLAEQNFDKEGVNRVILATDGDFNVGVSSDEELKTLIEQKRASGVFLSVLGFGQGNLNDSLMQTLAQNGNGTAAYIDTLNEARKVLVEESASTLFPIAKDVKIQVEFNPAQVAEYRLVGYETRALNREDFNNDKVDAGDIGAGHAVTALYEITPKGSENRSVDELRYGGITKEEDDKISSGFSGELAFLKIRYKLPNEDASKLITAPITSANTGGTVDTDWAVAVAGFGQLLKGDTHIGSFTYDDVITLAQKSKGDDPYGLRAEFINLVRLVKSTRNIQTPSEPVPQPIQPMPMEGGGFTR